MKIQKNENITDRLIRILLGEIFFMLAFFWTGGVLSVILYILTIILLFTALTGFCLLYVPFGINTLNKFPGKTSKVFIAVFIILFIIIATIGSYFSNFFTKKFFLNDYNAMNNYYKQTLFATGRDKRQEAKDYYSKLVSQYDYFFNKYTSYHPFALKNDGKLDQDLENIRDIFTKEKDNIVSGDLNKVHIALEEARPVLQDILRRNNFSLLAVYLVDFHDSMEKMTEASDEKDAGKVVKAYDDANSKMLMVEQEANDNEIQTIRRLLEELNSLAKEGKTEELPVKAAELKSSFAKVYLKRG